MTKDTTERLQYYQSQYLGAEDFKAQQAYHRDMRRRHNLGHHTWGIVTGLELVEQPQEGMDAGVDVYVQPGMAIDGFGREIIILNPHRLDPVLFDAFTTSQHRAIWIAYNEERTRRPASGYELCDETEQFGRVQETFRIVSEPPPANDPIIVAGEDTTISEKFSVPSDQSVPFQEFSDDVITRWLVRLGSVNWDGLDQKFVEAADGRLLEGRQYVGNITAEVLVPTEKLLIRDRDIGSPLPDDENGVAVTVEGKLQVERLLTAKQDLHVQGKVGIGTASPGAKLEITGDAEPYLLLKGGTSTTDIPELRLEQTTGGIEDAPKITFLNPDVDATNLAALVMRDRSAFTFEYPLSTRLLTIGTSGNIGIGESNPNTPLAIKKAGASAPVGITQKQVGGSYTMELTTADDDLDQATRILLRGGSDTANIEFYRGNRGAETPSMIIEGTTGNVGIGTASPGAKLEITSDAEPYLLLKGGTSTTDIPELRLEQTTGGIEDAPKITFLNPDVHATNLAALVMRDGSSFAFEYPVSTRLMTIDTFGNVGIGSENPCAKLDVDGRIIRKGEAFSEVGEKFHNETVSVPWGNTDDWNIFVSPKIMGDEEHDSEADNALLKIECYATEESETEWRITARYKFKYWSDNPRNGVWYESADNMDRPKVNYILVPK
jgi:hypothetical protein